MRDGETRPDSGASEFSEARARPCGNNGAEGEVCAERKRCLPFPLLMGCERDLSFKVEAKTQSNEFPQEAARSAVMSADDKAGSTL